MVGRRQFSNGNQEGKPMKSNFRPNPKDGNYGTTSSTPRVSGRERFQDVVHSVIADGRREQMKKKLIDGVKNNNLERFRKSEDELKKIKDKKIRTFYEKQNEHLNDWLEVDTLVRFVADDVFDSFDPHDDDGDGIPDPGRLQQLHGDVEAFLPDDEREKRKKSEKQNWWAININVIANIFLLIGKIVAAFASGSISLIASLVDSALDLLCTIIIWTTNRLVTWRISKLAKTFPIGRRRLEPLGILVFSVLMIVSFLQILQESVKKVLPGAPHEASELPPIAIGAMAGTVVIKGIIWIGCARIKTSQVQALAQDCKTDVVFNTLSLLFPLIGSKTGLWWLDPAGAGFLSLFIIFDWASTLFENVARLTGISADEKVTKKLMYLAWRFSPIVDAYKSITAYHAGEGVWCEVDLILDEKTPLEEAHDVAETLQYCMEGLNEVDRAFVTVDYSSVGPTGHAGG